MAANEARNIERPTGPVYQNVVCGKTGIQQEVFGEMMFRGKCPCIVIRRSDKNYWKAC